MKIDGIRYTLKLVEVGNDHYILTFINWLWRLRWAIRLHKLWPFHLHIDEGTLFEKHGYTRLAYISQWFGSPRIDRIPDGSKLIFTGISFDEFNCPGIILNRWGTMEDIDLDRFAEALWDGVFRRIDLDG